MFKFRMHVIILIFTLAVPGLTQDLISFVEKPALLNTGTFGEGVNHYRPRWSPDGQWLSFELIDENSLRAFVIKPGTDIIFECQGKQRGSYSGGLDIFQSASNRKAAITRISWARQLFNKTAMFCFTDDGALYKSFAYEASGTPAVSPAGEYIPANKMGDVGRYNGVIIPEMGYTPSRGQPPVLFTDNDTGVLFAIYETQKPMQLTFKKPDDKFTDAVGKFRPLDNRSIVFVRAFEGNSDIYLIEDVTRPAESIKPLTQWPKSDEVAPSWSPDGKMIAFYSNYAENAEGKKSFDLYLLDPASKKPPAMIARSVRPDNIEEMAGPPYQGPQWMGNDVIIYVKDDKPTKDPLMYIKVSTGETDVLPVGTIINDSPSICDMGDGTYYLAYTTFGKSTADLSRPDITNKIYYAKMIFSR